MNKLYRYLPFSIEVQYENAVKKLNFNGNILSGKGTLTGIDYIGEYVTIDSNITAKFCDVKPILRSIIGNIQKPTALNKLAAQILGEKEGLIICPKNYLSGVFSETKLDALRALHFSIDFFDDEFIPKTEG